MRSGCATSGTAIGADLAEADALSRQAAEAIPVGYANAGLVRSGLAAVLGTRQGDATAPDRPVSGPAVLTRAELLATVASRVERFKRDEHGAVLEPGAADDARRAAELLAAEEGDELDGWEIVGLFCWMRRDALPEQEQDARDEAFEGAVRGYLRLFLAGRDVPEGLRPGVAEAALDAMTELAQRVTATLDSALIDQYVLLGRRLLDIVPSDSPWRPAYQLLAGSALIMRFQRAGAAADFDAGIADIDQAITGTPTGDAFYPAMLASHGDALRTRFEHAGDPRTSTGPSTKAGGRWR